MEFGFDGIRSDVIQNNTKKLVPIITRLTNAVLEDGQYPDYLKTTIITPIFKKAAKNTVENYRPISLTSTLSKILETILKRRLEKHILENNIINKHQYAFQRKSGTASAVTDLIHSITQKLDRGETVVTIFIDG